MVERIIRNVAYDISRNGQGFVLFITTYYVESSITGGSIQREHQTYDRLTAQELRDLLECLASGAVPGERLPETSGQLSLI
uniref:Uncharacterized protein n=1 Tax=uncultured prokaryote TaxID=198431 RepID=A0A0H5Q5Y6_9ZZZZ|nr:hypothetical protein [uncultured prokaryote]